VSPFAEIMKRAVETTPDAVGGAFADPTGEMVDGFSTTYNSNDWAILTAHYGVILAHLHAAFGIWHFGGPEYFVAQHAKLDIVVHSLDRGYYVLLAIERGPDDNRTTPSNNLAQHALPALRTAATALRREMA
jgi:hypothetical protein